MLVDSQGGVGSPAKANLLHQFVLVIQQTLLDPLGLPLPRQLSGEVILLLPRAPSAQRRGDRWVQVLVQSVSLFNQQRLKSEFSQL